MNGKTINQKKLDALAERINELTNSPTEYKTNGKVNIGHYHIMYAYGKAQLVRTANEAGGLSTPLGTGFSSYPYAYEEINAFIAGIKVIPTGNNEELNHE